VWDENINISLGLRVVIAEISALDETVVVGQFRVHGIGVLQSLMVLQVERGTEEGG
jgi:hypothetical protein